MNANNDDQHEQHIVVNEDTGEANVQNIFFKDDLEEGVEYYSR